MDNLVLIRVADAYARSLAGFALRDVRQDVDRAFRLLFADGERTRSVLCDLDPTHPWTGRPVGRGRTRRAAVGSFAATAAKSLRGAVLRRVEKPPAERRLSFVFADGRSLVAELVPHRTNLVLVDPAGSVIAAARRSRRGPGGAVAGRPYEPPSIPAGRCDPFGASPESVRGQLRSQAGGGRIGAETLTRACLGIGAVAAELLVEESRGGGRDVLALLAERLVALAEGSVDPVIETREDPLEAARAGRLAQARCRILPWEPPWPPADGTRRIARGDPSATAGLYYGALALSVAGARRSVSLAGILEREIRRLREVEARIQADLRTFSDPDRYRIAGEALLAGLGEARRAGDHVLVPDPYDSDRGSIPIRAAPGRSLTQVAEDYFLRHRRARRGIERARERLLQVGGRRSRLEALQQQQEGRTGAEAADRLELAMQAEGIPVGLDRVPGRRQEAAAERRARVEGVRLFLSRDGETILVGKSGPANHRLTFKLAAPDDFWLHARGAAGAHVVVRNERRLRRPPAATLTEAAEAAAWFSEAREQPWADVQWTRRKYVRKMRGAPPGTVIVKRSETVRVRPRLPAALEGAS